VSVEVETSRERTGLEHLGGLRVRKRNGQRSPSERGRGRNALCTGWAAEC
jgi:hypothetical protein